MATVNVETLKVFLAEDEFVVREGIKNKIDWEANGLLFCGEASDGELAFPQIQKEKPDILITDIRMPFMDGLELSRLVKKELPDTEIIILSGFEEFEYARAGIKIGVAEYLTKPINASDLLAEINKVADIVRKRKEDERMRAQYGKEMQESFRLEKKDLFKTLVLGEASVGSVIRMAEKLNLSVTALSYNLLLLKIVSNKHSESEFSGSLVKTDDEIEEYIETRKIISFDRTPEGKAYLFMGDSREEVKAGISEFEKKVKEIVDKCPTNRYFGASGICVSRISEISKCYEAAGKAFAFRFFEKESTFLDGSVEMAGPVNLYDNFNVNDVNPGIVNRSKIMDFLKTGPMDEASFFVDAFIKEVGETAVNSAMFRQYMAMDAYFAVAEFVESIGLSREYVESFDAGSGFLNNVEKTKEYITRIIQAAIDQRDRLSTNRYDTVMNEVYKYIDANYQTEELSLNEIALHVNFSPSHLSMIFSQQTGKTLIKYITDVRMNRAKELLRCTSKRSGEISSMVGYQDPHYFSYLFKKTQGLTPTDFRNLKTYDEGEDA